MRRGDRKSKDVRHITCPRCRGGLLLDGEVFGIVEHGNDTWTTAFAVDCSHDCGAYFFVTRSTIEHVERKGN